MRYGDILNVEENLVFDREDLHLLCRTYSYYGNPMRLYPNNNMPQKDQVECPLQTSRYSASGRSLFFFPQKKTEMIAGKHYTYFGPQIYSNLPASPTVSLHI